MQVEQIRGTGEVVAMRQNHSALEKQLDALKQLLVSEREARQIQWATRSRKSGPSGAVVPYPPPSQVFNFGGANSQQPLPPAPVWPAHNGDFVFGRAASAGVALAPEEPEDEKQTVVVRPPELETGANGEGDEGGAEGEQQPGPWGYMAGGTAAGHSRQAPTSSLRPRGEDHERKVARRHSEQG